MQYLVQIYVLTIKASMTYNDFFKCENQKTKVCWKVTGLCISLLIVIILVVALTSNR